MPLYFFDTYDGFVSIDETGMDLPGLSAVHEQVRATLPSMLAHEARGANKAQFRIDVRDEAGARIVTGTVVMVIDCVQEPAQTRKPRSPDHASSTPSIFSR